MTIITSVIVPLLNIHSKGIIHSSKLPVLKIRNKKIRNEIVYKVTGYVGKSINYFSTSDFSRMKPYLFIPEPKTLIIMIQAEICFGFTRSNSKKTTTISESNDSFSLSSKWNTRDENFMIFHTVILVVEVIA